MKHPTLSIIVPVYNHEDYLAAAIRSIEEQNLQYSYEVLIGEDCSSDNSKQVLKVIQNNVPDNFRFFYREHNLGMFGNIADLLKRAKGDYITILEGDDYWIYPDKVNRQISFLEKHPEYSGTAHKVIVVDKYGCKLSMDYPCCQKKEYTLAEYLEGFLPGQTGTFVYRNYFIEKLLLDYFPSLTPYPLDRFISFVIASYGKIYCFEEQWSAYRYVPQSGSSFSARVKTQRKGYGEFALQYHASLYQYAKREQKSRLCLEVSEKLYYKSFLRHWLMQTKRNPVVLFSELRKAIYPFRTLKWIVRQLFCTRLKRRKSIESIYTNHS